MSGLNHNSLRVAKTIKLFINGKFPRTESGRSFSVNYHGSETTYANLCRASRKDLRAAVEAAKSAQAGWAGRTAYNRSQIFYRMAEMMEGKRLELVTALGEVMGLSEEKAQAEVDKAIDALIYYSGFADKFSQVMASVNPVSGPYHNFTTPEPMGVVGLLYNEEFSLENFVAQIAAILCSGNTLVAIFDGPGASLLGVLAETFATSDLPGGVVNLLSGQIEELYSHLGGHMEVHSICYVGANKGHYSELKEMAIENMKRVFTDSKEVKSLQAITNFTEYKTIWHPVGL